MKSKTLRALAILLCVLSVCSASYAAEGTRIAVVRIQEIFRKSVYAKEMETQIRASFRQEEAEIEDLQNKLRDGQEKLQNNTLLARDSVEYKEQVMRLQILELKLREKMENYTKLSRQRMAGFWRSVYKDFQIAIKAIAQTGRYDLIITAPDIDLSENTETSTAPVAVMNEILQRRVQYVSTRIDITNQVLQLMNTNHKQRRATH